MMMVMMEDETIAMIVMIRLMLVMQLRMMLGVSIVQSITMTTMMGMMMMMMMTRHVPATGQCTCHRQEERVIGGRLAGEARTQGR